MKVCVMGVLMLKHCTSTIISGVTVNQTDTVKKLEEVPTHVQTIYTPTEQGWERAGERERVREGGVVCAILCRD